MTLWKKPVENAHTPTEIDQQPGNSNLHNTCNTSITFDLFQ